MILLHLLQFIVIYSFIKLFVLCDFTTTSSLSDEEYDVDVNSLNENSGSEENYVLDSVYDTMKNNYEMRMRQNLHKLNVISDIRNKRNINEPISSANSMEGFKNHHQFDVNRKSPSSYPLGFKNPTPPKYYYAQVVNPSVAAPPPPLQPRSDRSEYEYEEYTKCQESKPTVQTFHISDHQSKDDGKHHLPELSGVLLTGLKYLLGGFAILALPFIVLKALLLPLKFFIFFKAFALAKTFFLMTALMRFLRFKRRVYNAAHPFAPLPPLPFNKGNKSKLQTIKDILESEDQIDEDDVDYDKSEDDDGVMSKENPDAVSKLYESPLNSSEVGEEIVQNLVKLIKLKNKNW